MHKSLKDIEELFPFLYQMVLYMLLEKISISIGNMVYLKYKILQVKVVSV
jgi:hypothetical protein